MSLQSTAGNLLQRAVELDGKKRYTEALICYQEGLQVLVDVLKEQDGEKRVYLRAKVEEYMKRAEQIKELIEKLKREGNFHEQIHVENDSIGHSYNSIFSRFLDQDVDNIRIEDPYIRTHHQCQNLVRFSELVVKKCTQVRFIELITVNSGAEQAKWLNEVQNSLLQRKVNLKITYSDTLHDRQITLSTGWIIKIGRGLDYFKAPQTKFSLGTFDLDLRPCHETTVDIFHSNTVRNK
ncbi:MIT domain-containing protein 1-like [Photinus pyralis]|uniref:MIT domain-containing protein n=2 Tax=Photinus pyralis TaxID=7054 RepID=A0A1Y1LQ01_PHOPY|nr:MIT domain-containing protein 1-like [Photinus pyralis]